MQVSKTATENGGDLTQTEAHLYGSSRLGIYTLSRKVEHRVVNTTGIYTFERGNKFFELSNHLGNVLVTVSDRKLQVQNQTTATLIDYYTADVITATDYYPFGMDMPGRKFGAAGRYGFNGKERDKDMNSLTAYDYGLRIYNPALGRFLSVDPLGKKFPFLTPYQYAGNSPIAFVDLDGAEQNYFMFKLVAESIEAEAALYKGNYKEMPFRLQSQLFMLAMAKNASVEGLMYEIDKGVRDMFADLPSINFNELPPSVRYGMIEQQVDRSVLFGLPALIKGLDATWEGAKQGNPEAMGNIAGMLLAAKLFKLPESELSSTASGRFLQNAETVAGSSEEVLGQIANGVGEFKELEVVVVKAPKHHIATNKNSVSTASGGPWTPRFKTFFDNAGLDINKGSENLVNVVNHKGPHPEAYHQLVFDRLTTATQGLKANTAAYKTAVTNTLQTIGTEAQQVGSTVNKLLTKNP